jgi:hypothetical protein
MVEDIRSIGTIGATLQAKNHIMDYETFLRNERAQKALSLFGRLTSKEK